MYRTIQNQQLYSSMYFILLNQHFLDFMGAKYNFILHLSYTKKNTKLQEFLLFLITIFYMSLHGFCIKTSSCDDIKRFFSTCNSSVVYYLNRTNSHLQKTLAYRIISIDNSFIFKLFFMTISLKSFVVIKRKKIMIF